MKHSGRTLTTETGTYPIIEPSFSIEVQVGEEDAHTQGQWDPKHCAIAEACKRLGAKEAIIGSTIAYIVAPVDGEEVAMRFQVPLATREAISTFDRSGRIEGAVTLLPISAMNTLASKKKRNKRHYQNQKNGTVKKMVKRPVARVSRTAGPMIVQHTHPEG